MPVGIGNFYLLTILRVKKIFSDGYKFKLEIFQKKKKLSDVFGKKIRILFKNLIVLSNLPFHHKDPFDRIIITQAITENLIIGSDDAIFKEYNIKLY